LLDLQSTKIFYDKYRLTPEKEEFLKKYITRLNNKEFKGETKGYLAFHKFLEVVLDYIEGEHIKFDEKDDVGQGRVEFCLHDENGKFMAIELKGSEVELNKPQKRVHDTRTPISQAFDYAKKSSTESGEIDWVFVSNYNEFRMHHWTKREKPFISFKAEELLDPETFKIFMFIFSKDSHLDSKVINDVIKEDYIAKTKLVNNFYKLFNDTRLMIYKELNEIHGIEKNQAISYAQTILDRFIFICFASSRDLLPPNIAQKTLADRIKQENFRDHEIWRELNHLFIDVNEGKEDRNIPKYNGGLFKKDFKEIELKDIINDPKFFNGIRQKWNFVEYEKRLNIEIKPSILKRINPIFVNLLIISLFDFSERKKSDNGHKVDIEILGHIFENSIGEIEEIKNDTKGRRKKEGIYYTPEYITDYICRNTIIPYLSKTGNADTLEELLNEYSWSRDIDDLDEKLQKIKIVDPACGSGAFLNKATDILLEIHEAIFHIRRRFTRTASKPTAKGNIFIKYFDLDSVLFDSMSKRREILTTNIFGVDLNEESVEITQLSLFLKVCQKEKELPHIEKNIINGNSLIEDDKFTDKSFQWEAQEKFIEIFDNGGFDIVIGNPPYVRQEKIKDMKPYLEENYPETYHGLADLYVYFFEKGLNILKPGGMFAFICANKFLRTKNDKPIRRFILKHKFLKYIDYTGVNVFDDVTTNPCIIILKNEKSDPEDKICVNDKFYLKQSKFDENVWAFEDPKVLKLKNKLIQLGTKIKEIDSLNIYYGIKTGYDTAFIINEQTRNLLIKEDSRNNEILKPLLRGRNIKKYKNDFKGIYLIYVPWHFPLNNSEIKGASEKAEKEFEKQFKSLYNFLLHHKERLLNRNQAEVGKRYEWYALQRFAPDYIEEFENEKIIWSNIANEPNFSYSNDGKFVDASAYFLTLKDSELDLKYILANLNSNINNFIYNLIGEKIAGGYQQWKKNKVEQLLIYPANQEQQEKFMIKVDELLKLNENLLDEVNAFKIWMEQNYELTKFSKKLENYYELEDINELLSELRKKKIKPSPGKIKILSKVFNKSKEEVNNLKSKITKLNSDIDDMIYNLYELNEEEIEIINEFIKK